MSIRSENLKYSVEPLVIIPEGDEFQIHSGYNAGDYRQHLATISAEALPTYLREHAEQSKIPRRKVEKPIFDLPETSLAIDISGIKL